MSDYEEFIRTGFNVRNRKRRVARLTGRFGDGYQANALAGSPYALLRWTLQCDALPNSAEYMIERPDAAAQTRAEYFQDFWDRHQAEVTEGIVTAVNKPFIFTDPTTRKRYFASFVEPEENFEVITAYLFTTGIEIEMRRIHGVNTLPDGSIGDDDDTGNTDEI